MYLNLTVLSTCYFSNSILFLSDLLRSLEIFFLYHLTENSAFGSLIDVLLNPISIRITILFSFCIWVGPVQTHRWSGYRWARKDSSRKLVERNKTLLTRCSGKVM